MRDDHILHNDAITGATIRPLVIYPDRRCFRVPFEIDITTGKAVLVSAGRSVCRCRTA